MTCPTMLAVSTLFATIPMTIPREAKNMGPRIRKGMSHADKEICAPKPNIPTPTIRTKEITPRKIYQSIFETSHSPLDKGVSESCLKSLSFLYNEEILTSENIGLIRMDNPIRPEVNVCEGLSFHRGLIYADHWIASSAPEVKLVYRRVNGAAHHRAG